MKKILLACLVVGVVGCGKEETPKQEIPKANDYVEKQKTPTKDVLNINPKMDIVDLAKCTSASMKIGQGIGVYKVWVNELGRRYSEIYSNKSPQEIEDYVAERIDDKLKTLRRSGLDTQQSFTNYYNMNCKN